MKIKKILIILIFFNLIFTNVYSIEPDVFVQSTVNRASLYYLKISPKIKKLMN